jgi:hypothetical protein
MTPDILAMTALLIAINGMLVAKVGMAMPIPKYHFVVIGRWVMRLAAALFAIAAAWILVRR